MTTHELRQEPWCAIAPHARAGAVAFLPPTVHNARMRLSNLAPALPLAAALALGCASKQRPVVKEGIRQPAVTFQAVGVESLDLAGTRLLFDFRLENPNSFSVDLGPVAWRFEVDGHPVAEGTLPAGATVPSGGAVPIRFPVRVDFTRLPGSAARFAIGGGPRYRISGVAPVSRTPAPVAVAVAVAVAASSQPGPAPAAAPAPVDLPFEYQDQLGMPKPPEVGVEGIGVGESALTEVSLSVRIKLENPNAFPLPSGQVSYGVTLAGKPVMSAEAKTIGALPPHGKTVLVVPVKLSLAAAGRAFSQLVRLKPVEVGVHGEVELGGFRVPVGSEATVQPAR